MALVLHADLRLLQGHVYCWISAFNFLRITARLVFQLEVISSKQYAAVLVLLVLVQVH